MIEDFGEESYFPEDLKSKILNVKRLVYTKEMKKRYKFLSHLPIYSEFYFIEIDMKNILKEKIYKKF